MKISKIAKVGKWSLLVLLTGAVVSCGYESRSSDKVVDIPSTQSKWQSIGNCWAYSAVGWVESLSLKNTGKTLNLSETYVTYRDWQEKLVTATELQVGGSFRRALKLMSTYGIVLEGDMIPNEANETKSETQARAEQYILTSMQSGRLQLDRSPETIISELDAAFGVNISKVEKKVISFSKLMVGRRSDGSLRSAQAEANDWVALDWPGDNMPGKIPGQSKKLSDEELKILKIVKQGLNAHHPIVMDWFVDFGALNSKGIFDLESLNDNPLAKQGYHSTVLEDYVVRVKNPETGLETIIGEGEVSQEEKDLALEQGQIKYFVVKNSWGGTERKDRASYMRGNVGGFHRLEANYLFAFLNNRESNWTTPVITRFIVPKDLVK
jgi:hypothetical protein